MRAAAAQPLLAVPCCVGRWPCYAAPLPRRETDLESPITLFVTSFTTLLAIINPLEALPVFMGLAESRSTDEQRALAKRSCVYALALMFFFLIFGSLLMRIFGVPMSMVRVVGGIVLMRIGFQLFDGNLNGDAPASPTTGGHGQTDPAFVPLAMPIMFGPGAIATVLGMVSLVRTDAHGGSFPIASLAAIVAAMLATIAVTYFTLLRSNMIMKRIGPMGLDAATRIVGFFVAAMGGGLIFHGVVEALHTMN